MIFALSLVMVACNKEEETEQLTGWDMIIAGVESVDVAVLDVLHSLGENEVWQCRSAYAYILNETTGEVEEHIYVKDYFSYLYGATMPTLRYADNQELRYWKPASFTGETDPYAIVYDVSMEDDAIKLVSCDDVSKYKIVAYDENQIIFEEYVASEEGTKWLYKKMWYERKVDDSKWWEKVEINK